MKKADRLFVTVVITPGDKVFLQKCSSLNSRSVSKQAMLYIIEGMRADYASMSNKYAANDTSRAHQRHEGSRREEEDDTEQYENTTK